LKHNLKEEYLKFDIHQQLT